jgi:mannobiose 2-epimerase
VKKPVHDRERGGVFDVFQRETDQHQWHTNKPWWQNCEAMLACTLAIKLGVVRDPAIVALRDRAVDFYFHHFVDPDGGERDVVTTEGQPTGDTVKGSGGKSTYHTVELARYMLLYLGESHR